MNSQSLQAAAHQPSQKDAPVLASVPIGVETAADDLGLGRYLAAQLLGLT